MQGVRQGHAGCPQRAPTGLAGVPRQRRRQLRAPGWLGAGRSGGVGPLPGHTLAASPQATTAKASTPSSSLPPASSRTAALPTTTTSWSTSSCERPRESRPAGWAELRHPPGGGGGGLRLAPGWGGLRCPHAWPRAPCLSAGQSPPPRHLFRCWWPPRRTHPARPRLVSVGAMLVVLAASPSTYCVSGVYARDLP